MACWLLLLYARRQLGTRNRLLQEDPDRGERDGIILLDNCEIGWIRLT